MNCPHCGMVIPAKSKVNKAEIAYREDVKRAENAIMVLERCTIPVLVEACKDEIVRLRDFIRKPEKLYFVYRRGDKKTPIGYGMFSQGVSNAT